MAANALIQTRIDAAVKEQATTVLESMGLTVSDAVRILLTRVAKEGALPAGLTAAPEAHDAWFKSKVIEALRDTTQTYNHEEVTERFNTKREALMKKSHGA
ncbi:MAG: type II toxin-antitoxin system RelB/DinJ family antitoxin [Aequoribacter sp.]|jgi:DNA-damage-inducible protein J|uniref:type II toxin-antitoxin system RelB/DinJ family antitoxin n=1 Tax=Aequoribacter sp. TaxID=2847771 RepID=UPI003C3D5001